MSGNSQERRSSKVAIPTRQGSFNAEPYSHRTYLNSPNQNDYLSGRRGSVESIADAIHAMATGREKVLSSSPKTFDAEFLSGKGNEASRNGKSAVAPIDQSTSDQPATDEIEFPLPNVEKFVFISPNFPPVVAEYARALRQRGITVLGIGDAAYDSLSWELRQNLTEYYKILSPGGLHDYEECLKACGFFTWKYGRLHRIESFNETWLPLESRLRQDLNVPGLLPTDLIMMRTKSGMRDLFTSHEVPNPGGMMAESLEALLEYIDGPNGVGWPVVLKPDIGVGAASTHKIPTAAALASWFSTTPNPEYYIAQPFINAPIVTFDGFAGRSGDVLVASSVEYSDGVMEAVNEAREIFFYETRELDPALLEMGRRIVKDVLGLRERWFHIEFFRTAHGYMMLEANLRPPGVWIPKMIGYATGTDPFAIYAGHLRSEERGGMATPKHTIAHITRRTYNHSYRLTKKQLVKHFGENLLDVLEMPEVFREALGEEGYIIRVEWTGQGREEERKAVLGVAAIVQEHGVPEPEDEEVEETEETAETDAA